MNENIKIVDNFLDQKEFVKLQTYMMGPEAPWFFIDGIEYLHEKGKFQFILKFYGDNAPLPICEKVFPILDIIQPVSIWRIKANLLTITPTIVENSFHTDVEDLPKEKIKVWTTSIFYMNNNNGYTEFEDGTKVESVANRMVTFSTNIKHRGTSCTDEKTRVVINFNYFK